MTNATYLELLCDELGWTMNQMVNALALAQAKDDSDEEEYDMDMSKKMYDYLASLNDEEKIVTTKHVIYRYDINVPDDFLDELDDLGNSYRELLVWYIFKVGLDFKEALNTVFDRINYDKLIDWENDPYGDPIDWHEVDHFALDGSKTFVNGRRYL